MLYVIVLPICLIKYTSKSVLDPTRFYQVCLADGPRQTKQDCGVVLRNWNPLSQDNTSTALPTGLGGEVLSPTIDENKRRFSQNADTQSEPRPWTIWLKGTSG